MLTNIKKNGATLALALNDEMYVDIQLLLKKVDVYRVFTRCHGTLRLKNSACQIPYKNNENISFPLFS